MTAWLTLRPTLSRHRTNRLASSRSHGWRMRSNRSRARVPSMPSRRSSHTSRGNSLSQPLPWARSSRCVYA